MWTIYKKQRKNPKLNKKRKNRRFKVKGETPSITNLATTAALTAKINEVKNKKSNITNFPTGTALTVFENKIPNVSNLVKKTDYNTKISEIEKKITDHDHDKYITTPEFNQLTAENFAARLAQANLASKNDIANFIKKTDFDDKLKNLNKKVTSNKAKHLVVKNEFKKLQPFDSSLFIGQSYFNNYGTQLHLILQPIYKTITTFSIIADTLPEWEFKGLSNEKFMRAYIANVSVCSN